MRRALFLLLPAIVLSAASEPARADQPAPQMAGTLEESLRIAREVENRLRARGTDLRVSEVTSTRVVATLEVAPSSTRSARSVPADNGVYFSICRRVPCAVHRQRISARVALLARRAALELALRTLKETSADLVVVALPKRGVATVWLVLARSEVDVGDAAGRELRALQSRGRVGAGALSDRVAREHLYVVAGLVPYSRTRDSMAAIPLFERSDS